MRKFILFVLLTVAPACVSYSNLHPVYPDVGHPAYSVVNVGTLQPTLRWQAASTASAGYDLVVYEGPETFFGYIERGDHKIVYAREKILKAEHTLEEPLQAGRFFLWTVREHSADGKSEWSRYNYTGVMPVPPFVYWTNDQLFRFSTPQMTKVEAPQ